MLFTVFYFISFIVSISTIATGLFVAFYRKHSIRPLPKALRLYLLVSYFLPVMATAAISFATAFTYFCFGNEIMDPAAKYFRLLTVFASQSIRNFFFTIVLERLIATILLEKYILSYKICFFWALFFFSNLFTFIFGFMFYKSGFISNDLPGYKIFNFSVFTFYLFTMATFTLLLILNKFMYKVTAYRITLKKRHQIMENVKVLSYLFLPILIYTILTPFGTVITITGFYVDLPDFPPCIFQFALSAQKLLIIQSVVDFMIANSWYISMSSVIFAYVSSLQFLGHLLLALNRFTLICIPTKHENFWKRQWYTVLLILIPLIMVSWRIHQPLFLISDSTGGYYVKYGDTYASLINYTVTSCFYIITTFLAGILNFVAFLKFLFYKQNNNVLQVNEKRLLFVSLICFVFQLLRCSYNFGRLFDDPNVFTFLTSILPYLNDIFAWSGSISLMFLSSSTRKLYSTFYLCESVPHQSLTKVSHVNTVLTYHS